MIEVYFMAQGMHRAWYQPNPMNNKFESTYAMLVHSEEKGRRILEFLVYAVFAFSAVMSIFQFASA